MFLYNVGISSVNGRKTKFRFVKKLKNMKINCHVAYITNKLMIVAKKTTNFSDISCAPVKLFNNDV